MINETGQIIPDYDLAQGTGDKEWSGWCRSTCSIPMGWNTKASWHFDFPPLSSGPYTVLWNMCIDDRMTFNTPHFNCS